MFFVFAAPSVYAGIQLFLFLPLSMKAKKRKGDCFMAQTRFYWLKMREDFFQQKFIRLLLNRPEGTELVLLYIKLLLSTISGEGTLSFDHMEGTLAEELAIQLDCDKALIARLLDLLEQCGRLERLDGTGDKFRLPEAADSIGSAGTSAQRMREMRKREREEMDAGETEGR